MTPEPRARLTATLGPADSYAAVCEAIRQLFPLSIPEERDDGEPGFPAMEIRPEIVIEGLDMTRFFEQILKQRICDSALDCMSQNLSENETNFRISSQAAMAGKVAFVLPYENVHGGTFQIGLESESLSAWLESSTWHHGRDRIPRKVGDDNRMRGDGFPQEWFD